jgi:hypothetical protein
VEEPVISRLSPGQLSLASTVVGVIGLLFPPAAPLAIYLARKSSHSGAPKTRAEVALSGAGLILGFLGSAFLAVLLVVAGVSLFVAFTSK